jgi:hypothetical protein
MQAPCSAHSKRSGEGCKSRAVIGRTTCRMHGGKTPVGIGSPHLKSGRYSKLLPARLLERYQQQLTDPELLGLRDEIALLDARAEELVQQLGQDDLPGNWTKLRGSWTAYKQAQEALDELAMTEAFTSFDALMEQDGNEQNEREIWGEIHSLFALRRRLVESERKRITEMQQTLTTGQVLAVIAGVVDSVRRHVADPAALRAISHDIGRLTNY